MSNHRLRIAPTPSGFLHLGNAFNFILTGLLARSLHGTLRLRIDDEDAARLRPKYLEDIFETLHWLGISWDEGPRDVADHTANFSQSHHTSRYNDLIARLIATGQVFACNCSRKDILAASRDGQYPGTCRQKGLPLDAPDMALRILTPGDARVSIADEFLGRRTYHPYDETRDAIIHRRDGLPAYHIVSLADDIDHGITRIVRGEDLLPSTVLQRYLSQLLGGTPFDEVVFLHHPLLEDAGGRKLSKSEGSASLRSRRDAGKSSEEVFRHFAHFMLWPREVASLAEAFRPFETIGMIGWKSIFRRYPTRGGDGMPHP